VTEFIHRGFNIVNTFLWYSAERSGRIGYCSFCTVFFGLDSGKLLQIEIKFILWSSRWINVIIYRLIIT